MKKKPFLLSNISSMSSSKKRLVIGLIGTHKGVGVTHTGIMLANYLSAKLSTKTAFLECNSNNDFKFLQMDYEEIEEEELSRQFNIYDVTYFRNVTEHEITELLNDNFEVFILDLGSEFQRNKREFLRSDIKFVIGSLTEWKRESLIRFFKENSQYQSLDQWGFLVVFGVLDEIKELKRKWKHKIYGIPFEPDPFLLSKNSVRFFQSLW